MDATEKVFMPKCMLMQHKQFFVLLFVPLPFTDSIGQILINNNFQCCDGNKRKIEENLLKPITSQKGSAVIVKSNIKHHLHSEFPEDWMQATTITISESMGPINTKALYCPPKHNLKKRHI